MKACTRFSVPRFSSPINDRREPVLADALDDFSDL